MDDTISNAWIRMGWLGLGALARELHSRSARRAVGAGKSPLTWTTLPRRAS